MRVENNDIDRLVSLLSEMIQNKCVNDGTPESGNEIRNARTLKKFFSSCGLKSTILAKRPNRSNLFVRIPGSDPHAPSLCLMGHMDVVPVNEDSWSCDPFSGELKDGYIWGRGAVDMLNMTSSMAAGFAKAVTDHGQFPGDLMFLAVADEEASGTLGARWLTENYWNEIKTDYMITELGGFFLKGAEKPKLTIACGEKGLAWMRVTVTGTPGHGSMPFLADNAAVKLSRVVQLIANHKSNMKPHPAYCKMADGLSRNSFEAFLLKNPFTNGWALHRLAKRSKGQAQFLHSASRMTMSPDYLMSGKKVNIIADKGVLEIDIRILPGQSIEEVQHRVKQILKPLRNDIKIEFTDYFPSNISKLDTPLMAATKEIAEDHYPECELVPLFIGGVTDGRFFRQKGTTVYGFSLFDEELTMGEYAKRLHGNDERISRKSLEKSFDYFYRLPFEFFKKTAM